MAKLRYLERLATKFGRVLHLRSPKLPSTSASTFPYKPLRESKDEIRLLIIDPGQPLDPITCQLSHCSLSLNPQYSALSYTWGSVEDPMTISVEDCDFQVTQNLYKALQQLRSTTSRRTFWIDAVCINQSSISERNSQVPRMRDIYSRANQVVVWLGEASDDSDMAMDWLESVRTDKDEYLIESDTVEFQYSKTFIDMIQDTKYEATWKALHRFSCRGYWSRMWIIQEVAMAENLVVCCGSKSIPWPTIIQAMSMLKFVRERSTSPAVYTDTLDSIIAYNTPSILNALRRTRDKPKTASWMLTLLNEFRTSKSTDPRDKIFALLGLLVDPKISYSKTIRIDYALPVIEVFTDVVQFCIQGPRNQTIPHDETRPARTSTRMAPRHEENNTMGFAQLGFESNERPNRAHGPLNILCSAQLSGVAADDDFPTWLPDWTKYKGMHTIDTLSADRFRASRDEFIKPAFSDDRRFLTVHGIQIDALQHRSALTEQCISSVLDPPNKAALLGRVQRWLDLACTHDNFDTQRFWRTLVFDSNAKGWKDEAPESWYDMSISKLQDSLSATEPSDASGYLSMLLRTAWIRQFGITEKGNYLMLPVHSEPGDIICVLMGCDVPIVLRKTGDWWWWIGECFCWGYMDGEAIDSKGVWRKDVQQFELC